MMEEHLYVANSEIHGKGLFTGVSILPNTRICLVADLKLRSSLDKNKFITELGRTINHSNVGNSTLKQDGTCYYLHSLRDIAAMEELTSDYRKAPGCFDNNVIGFK